MNPRFNNSSGVFTMDSSASEKEIVIAKTK
jgi:hypothetical protein